MTGRTNILKKFIWPLALLFITASAIPAVGYSLSQETPSSEKLVKTDHLSLQVNPTAGTVRLTVMDSTEKEVYQTEIYGLWVGEKRQTDFKLNSKDPLRLSNDLIELQFDILDEHSISITQVPMDGQTHNFELKLKSDDQTRYYGTGERFNALNQRGYILPMITDDRYGNKGVGSHKPVPFVMSSQGFGFWLDSYTPSQFDLSGSERFETSVSVRDNKMRMVFFGGPGMNQILQSFTKLTGRPPVPPPWAFGLWKSRDVHHNRDSVMVDVQKPRELGIPASVIVLDSPWETGYNNFEVNEQQFTNSQSMFDEIRRRGYQLALWLTPFVNSQNVQDMEGIQPKSSNFDEAVQQDVLVTDSTGKVAQMDWWKGRGGLIDFTDQKAIDWWFNEMDKMLPTHVRAFKADDGEGNFVPDAMFHDGSSARAMKNRYAVLYDSVMQAYVNDRLDRNGVLITRTGYTGTQQYPFAWAGDNKGDFSFDEGLPSVILAGQNAAMSGFSLWGSDIAGYAGTADKEVFIRWTQFAAFTPFMQVHMTSNKGPWDYDKETLQIFRKFTRIRTQLFPYLYEAVKQSSATGIPVIRPMALAFPNDPEAADKIYQYMFGPDMLVAPIYQPTTERSVYLPKGGWIDYWTGRQFEGPKTIKAAAPIDKIPLFIRGGAIFPMIPSDVQTLVRRHEQMDEDIAALDDRRTIQVWPGEGGRLALKNGLEVSKKSENGNFSLDIHAADVQPVRVEFPFQDLKITGVSSNQVLYDKQEQATIVELPPGEKEITLQWSK